MQVEKERNHKLRNLLLLVGRLRLWWDSHNNDSSLLHILGGSHDEREQFAAFISRLIGQDTMSERAERLE